MSLLYKCLYCLEYLGVVTNALQTTSQSSQCTSAIEQATIALEDEIQSTSCCKRMEKLFSLCDPLDVANKLDVANLFETLAGNFEGVVQYNKDNRDFKGANITMDVLCDMMTDPKLGSPLARYATVNNVLLGTTGQKCLDFKYDKFLKDMRSTDWNSSASEGGKSLSLFLHVSLLYFVKIIVNSKVGNGLTKPALNLGITNRPTLRISPLGKDFQLNFPSVSVVIYLEGNSITSS